MFYAALDASLRSVAICIIDHDGKICLERSVRSEVPDVLLCLARFDQPIHQAGSWLQLSFRMMRDDAAPAEGRLGRSRMRLPGDALRQQPQRVPMDGRG
ncbi:MULTISPECIES: hypothetical protein [Bosea]|jgi:hypothetical protein|uniref:hypothetical protein n=1 Tax=Bosea TaxID=85413 RepID=UPI0021503072|nr:MULTISPECIES: hypothetical protein [Bosea]MCR4524656.1 hypothetical protein [Bosea sp. 47.2.35]MDR6831352.1 hypothetical protein [Bosea robiniae]MDR6898080.1 hypothetical protein [Bosea sp. BE109]MDR7141489.1 hypothetical protein [Bosea sp. BE168]